MRKKLIALLSLTMVFAMAFAGCGNTTADQSEQSQSTENSSTVEESATDTSTSTSESTDDVYQQFMDGQVSAFADVLAEKNADLLDDYQMTFSNQLVAGKAYTFDQFTKALEDAEAEFYPDQNFEPKSIEYAYIDCGNDGQQELAIRYNEMGPEDLDVNILCVFKEIDKKLECVFISTYGYRTDASLNGMGLYTTGGSGGAASSGSTSYYIDGDGIVHYDYNLEVSTEVYAFYLPDNEEYQTVAEEQGVSSSVQISQYSFTPYDENQEYSDYLAGCMFTFVPVDELYNPLEGDELAAAYEDGSPYMIFWESTKLPFSTQDEIDTAIAEHEAEIGMTDEVKNASEADWQTLQ